MIIEVPSSIQRAFRQLSKSIGMEGGLKFDEYGRCGMESNNGFLIQIRWNSDTGLVNFETGLGSVGEESAVDFYEMFLAANTRSEISGGGFFGLDLLTGQVVYIYTLPSERVDGRVLEETLSLFLQNASDWKEQLDTPADSEEGAAKEDNLRKTSGGILRV